MKNTFKNVRNITKMGSMFKRNKKKKDGETDGEGKDGDGTGDDKKDGEMTEEEVRIHWIVMA